MYSNHYDSVPRVAEGDHMDGIGIILEITVSSHDLS